jgi:hypothetical protein
MMDNVHDKLSSILSHLSIDPPKLAGLNNILRVRFAVGLTVSSQESKSTAEISDMLPRKTVMGGATWPHTQWQMP